MDLFQKSFSTNMAWCESTQVSGERQPRLRLGWRRALLSPKSLHPCAAHHRAARHPPKTSSVRLLSFQRDRHLFQGVFFYINK